MRCVGLALPFVRSPCFALWCGMERFEWISLQLGGVYDAGNIALLGVFAISRFLVILSYARSSSLWCYPSCGVKRTYTSYRVFLVCSAVAALGGGDDDRD